MSSAAGNYAWRRRAKEFCDHRYAGTANAATASSYARTVIAASAIAVSHVDGTHGSASDVAPTAVTSRAPKDGSTIAIGSGGIAAVSS